MFLNILEQSYIPSNYKGFYIQKWTSDQMMQALPVQVLRDAPLESLWYLHKQPPMLDSIRALIAQFFKKSSQKELLRNVDCGMYLLWSIFFAAMNVFVFFWIERLTNLWWGLLGALIWMLNPAPIFYATLLESTFISSFFILWFFYELWSLSKNEGQMVRFSIVSILLVYTRTLFQWYFFPMILISLILFKQSFHKILLYVGLVFVFVFPLIFKQYVLYGTTSTTTFAGDQKHSIIWCNPTYNEMKKMGSSKTSRYPLKASAYSGGDHFNSEQQYQRNIIYEEFFSQQLKKDFFGSIKNIGKSFLLNFNRYWKPSSKFTPNVITDHLMWSGLYNAIFSKTVYLGLLFLSFLIWFCLGVQEKGSVLFIRRAIGLLLPLVYIFIISNLCNRFSDKSKGIPDWTEADRMKFFLEPVYFIFITIHFYRLIEFINQRKTLGRVKSHGTN